MSSFSTERYDGKTRKDDIRKYTMIAVIVAAAVIACGIGIFLFHRAIAPDYTFVEANYGNIPEEVLENIEDVIGEVVGDKNNNGKVSVNAKSLMPAQFGDYEILLESMFTGNYVLFLLCDPDPYGEDIFIEKIDISSSPLLAECGGTYACILNTDERDVEEAEQIVAALLTAEPGTSE